MHFVNSVCFFLILWLVSFNSFAQNLFPSTQTINPVLAPINDLFDAMRDKDSAKIIAQFTDNALLQRLNKTGNITNTDITKFALSVANNSAKLDEHLLSINIQQQGGLASVWTPFAFYLNDKLSHCGSNSFQLVKVNGNWKIHYLIDVTYSGDCHKFIKLHSN